MVKAKLPLIEEVQGENWWTDVTPAMVETLRRQLRDLVPLLDRQQQQIVYTNFIDELEDISKQDVPTHQTGFSPYQYKKKVETYICNNENQSAIAEFWCQYYFSQSLREKFPQFVF